jgi:hypothetical protein
MKKTRMSTNTDRYPEFWYSGHSSLIGVDFATTCLGLISKSWNATNIHIDKTVVSIHNLGKTEKEIKN